MKKSIKALIASTLMGIIAYEIMQVKMLPMIVALMISIICSIISFIIFLKILKSQEMDQILYSLKKKRNAKTS